MQGCVRQPTAPVTEHTVTAGTSPLGNIATKTTLIYSGNTNIRRNTVNIRRSARHHNVGVRLNEETGTVTTGLSRAEAHRDALRTRAIATLGRR